MQLGAMLLHPVHLPTWVAKLIHLHQGTRTYLTPSMSSACSGVECLVILHRIDVVYGLQATVFYSMRCK